MSKARPVFVTKTVTIDPPLFGFTCRGLFAPITALYPQCFPTTTDGREAVMAITAITLYQFDTDLPEGWVLGWLRATLGHRESKEVGKAPA